MSTSGLKTIAIAILLLINALFLTVIISDAFADMRSQRETIENVSEVLRAGGIKIDPGDILTNDSIRTMHTARSVEAEAIIAEAILGQTVVSDQGVIYTYENAERGVAEFASAGDFEIRLREGAIMVTNDTLRTVQGLLRSMKLESTRLNVSVSPDGEIVSAVSAFRNASIFNCNIEFVFSEGSLHTIRGRYVAGFEPAEDGIVISPVGTALLGFLAEVKRDREDVDCTEIHSVEAGYHHRVAGSFGGVISPAWLIVTDNGTYLIDDTTGEIRPFSG